MNMKNILLVSSLLSLWPAVGKGQDIYNHVLDNATKMVNTPSTNFTQTRISQFKRTALVYLKQKAFETMPEVKADFLNTQAYYLSEFLTLFFNEILKDRSLKDDDRKEKIYMFMEASLNNPLFKDADEETVQSYIKVGSELTPFSLDTDWQKAYNEAKSNLK